MSRAFKILLLLAAAAASLVVYQYRESELFSLVEEFEQYSSGKVVAEDGPIDARGPRARVAGYLSDYESGASIAQDLLVIAWDAPAAPSDFDSFLDDGGAPPAGFGETFHDPALSEAVVDNDPSAEIEEVQPEVEPPSEFAVIEEYRAPPAEEPPLPEPAADEPVEIEYTVREKDRLWKIAERYLGRGLDYKKILEWNSLTESEGNRIRPGAKLRLQVSAEKARQAGKPQREDKAQRAKKENKPRRIVHKVRRGESLATLARRYFGGDNEAWRRIYAANRHVLRDPDHIVEGMELRIPTAAPGGAGR